MDTRKKIGLFTAIAGAALVASSLIGGTASAGPRPATDVTDPIVSHNTNGFLTEPKCDSTEWHWNITGLSGDGTIDSSDVPAFITVTWSGGNPPTNIPLDNVTGGVAHYRYTGHLADGVFPTGATASFPAGTDVTSYSQFNLSHGPCAPTVDTFVGPTEPEETTPDTTPETTQVGSEGPTTTVAGSSGGELPSTGSTQGLALTVGLVLLGLGAVLASLTRRSAAS